jgi:hypothetical protein
MTKIPKKLLLGGLACGAFLALSVPAMAIPISGSATWTGVLTLTSGGVLSFCPPVTPTQTPCPAVSGGPPGWNVPGSGTLDLAPYASDPAGGTITSLSSATNPVGVTLATPTLFMSFAPSPGVGDISFFMQTVFAGVGGSGSCGAAPAAGQTCTPAGSAVTFVNVAGGNSSATISMQGFARHASDGPGFATATPLQYIFTFQFNKSFQAVLADLAAGSITSTYSATATATPVSALTPTTTTVGSSVNPSVFGQSVTFTATVSPIPSGGTVDFVIDGSPVASGVPLNGMGQAVFVTSTLSVTGSPHTVIANYSGNPSFGSSSGSLTGDQTVNKDNTSTVVTSNVNPSVLGQLVTFTATVTATSPGSGTPGGTVNFIIDGATVASNVALAGGQATFQTSSLTVSGSPHTVVVNFTDTDGNFNNSSGSLAGGQTVLLQPRSWTSAGSTGTIDEDSQAIASVTNFVVGLLPNTTGTVTVRYNITATRGISSFCPATQSVVSVRFRNSDNSGTFAKVTFQIHSSSVATGGNNTIFTFSSNGIGAGSSFTTATFTPAIDFDFANNIYWIEATVFRGDPNQFANLGSIEIFESVGTPCP